MSEIENGRLDLYGTEHSKCNHLMTLGFKGLTLPITDAGVFVFVGFHVLRTGTEGEQACSSLITDEPQTRKLRRRSRVFFCCEY